MLSSFLYVSVSCLEAQGRDESIADIVSRARSRNESAGVTGVLVFSGVRFAQYLEGPDAALRTIVSSILKDRRHKQVTTLIKRPTSERRFADWSLAYSGPSLYVDRHIKLLVDARADGPLTAMQTNQLVRLMASLSQASDSRSGSLLRQKDKLMM